MHGLFSVHPLVLPPPPLLLLLLSVSSIDTDSHEDAIHPHCASGRGPTHRSVPTAAAAATALDLLLAPLQTAVFPIYIVQGPQIRVNSAPCKVVKIPDHKRYTQADTLTRQADRESRAPSQGEKCDFYVESLASQGLPPSFP